jgi:hypothetical protein
MSGVWLRSGTAGVGGCTCGPRRLHPGTASPYDALPEAVRLVADRPFTGDLDAMVQRRAIGVAVTFNRTHYFIDKGRERGITYEVLKSFEKDLNADLKTGSLKLHLVIVPMSSASLRNELAAKRSPTSALCGSTPIGSHPGRCLWPRHTSSSR